MAHPASVTAIGRRWPGPHLSVAPSQRSLLDRAARLRSPSSQARALRWRETGNEWEGRRENKHLRAAWAAGVALLAFLLPLIARAWPAAGAEAQADTKLFGVNAFAAAAVAATALSLDSLESATIGLHALLTAFAGATYGGHMPPSAVNVIVHVYLVATLLVACINWPGFVAFVSLSAYVATLYVGVPDGIRTLVYGAWTLSLFGAVGAYFFLFLLPTRFGLREATRLLLVSSPGLLLATALPATPELVALSSAALFLLGMALEVAFDLVDAISNAAFLAQDLRNARAQVQELRAQMAEEVADENAADDGAPVVPPAPGDRLCCICEDAAASHACLPCGHKCACRACLKVVLASATPDCPVCRRRIKSIAQIFSAV